MQQVRAQKISPFLWFAGQAEEAARFYTTLFEGSSIEEVRRWPEGSPFPAGTAMSATFVLAGLRFMALNGGPEYAFTPATSFFVDCADQAEVDRLWGALVEGGSPQPCGWLKDRFGLSWQIIPERLCELLSDEDPERSGRAVQAMMGMTKIDIAALERAAAGEALAS